MKGTLIPGNKAFFYQYLPQPSQGRGTAFKMKLKVTESTYFTLLQRDETLRNEICRVTSCLKNLISKLTYWCELHTPLRTFSFVARNVKTEDLPESLYYLALSLWKAEHSARTLHTRLPQTLQRANSILYPSHLLNFLLADSYEKFTHSAESSPLTWWLNLL